MNSELRLRLWLLDFDVPIERIAEDLELEFSRLLPGDAPGQNIKLGLSPKARHYALKGQRIRDARSVNGSIQTILERQPIVRHFGETASRFVLEGRSVRAA